MLKRLAAPVLCASALAASGCGGSSTSSPPPVSQTATPTATATSSAAPSATPAPTASPTAAPTATATPSPKPTGTAVPFTTFTNKLSSASTICFSAYVFTNASFSALDAAAKNGANETVILPAEEQSDDQGDANQLAADGAHIVYDQGTSTPPLHAKLALVDGSAFLDGRNWDSSDVVISDTYSSDYTAIANALALDPTSSSNLDTLKSIALAREANIITNASPSAGVTIRFMTESFSSGASNVISALEAAAQAGATVEVVVLSSYVQGNSGEMNLLTTLKNPPYDMSVRLNPASGSEKMTLVSNQTTGWFGSSNATSSSSSSDNYIDWGLTVTDPTVLSNLQSYYDTTYANSTPY